MTGEEGTPADEDAVDALKYQIQRAMERDEAFYKELKALLPEGVIAEANVVEKMNVSWTGSLGIQSTGSGSIRVQR